VKNAGCPASDGMPGIAALPSTPWHVTHGADFARPASRSPADATPPAAAIKPTATHRATGAAARRRQGRELRAGT